MAISIQDKERILQELKGLPADKVEEVLNFIGYLKMKGFNTGVDAASLLLQQQGLARIWTGEEENLYEL